MRSTLALASAMALLACGSTVKPSGYDTGGTGGQGPSAAPERPPTRGDVMPTPRTVARTAPPNAASPTQSGPLVLQGTPEIPDALAARLALDRGDFHDRPLFVSLT